MPGDFKPRGASRGGRGYGGRGRGRGGFSKANNYTNKKRSSPDAADDEEKAPQAKRAKATTGGDETDIIVPTVKQDEHANDYIAVSPAFSTGVHEQGVYELTVRILDQI